MQFKPTPFSPVNRKCPARYSNRLRLRQNYEKQSDEQKSGRTGESFPMTWIQGGTDGHWESNTLAVESTGYDERSWLDTNGYVNSDSMKMVERYTHPDALTLQISMTFDDPKIYTTPWSGQKTLKWCCPRAPRSSTSGTAYHQRRKALMKTSGTAQPG